jgi:hypothetical protein
VDTFVDSHSHIHANQHPDNNRYAYFNGYLYTHADSYSDFNRYRNADSDHHTN